MEKIAISTLALLALTFCFCACDPANYFDMNLGEAFMAPVDNVIPQEGGIITIPADWATATKFQFPQYFQAVKYRAYIGDELYSGMTVTYLRDRKIVIPVPGNDTHETLDVKVQVAFSDDRIWAGFYEDEEFESISFGEWQDKYSGIQAALPKGSPKKYDQIDNADLVLTVAGQQFNIITYDSWAAKCLKRRVAEYPFEYTGLNCSDSRIGLDASSYKNYIPSISREFRNDMQASGRIYYDCYWEGEIALYRDKFSFFTSTLIGDIAPDDVVRWQNLFKDANESPDFFKEMVKLSLAY